MEIHNIVNFQVIKTLCEKKEEKKQNKNISFSGNLESFSESALESMAKAKIQMDKEYTHPIPYEEKIKILKEKGIPEEDYELFISQNDEIFKKMIEDINLGIETHQIRLIYQTLYGSEPYKKAEDMVRYGIPFDFGKRLYSFNNIPEEKIDFLKQAKFDFSRNKINFRLDNTFDLIRILENEDYFKKFYSIYQKDVDANIALETVKLPQERYQKLEQILDEEKEISNSAATAYFLSNFKDEDVQEIIELSKANRLDFNNYDFWINTYKNCGLKNAEELLQYGVPADYVQINLSLTNDKIKEAVSFASKNGISISDSIDTYRYIPDDEERRKKACAISEKYNIDIITACKLSSYENSVIGSVIKYLKMGIDFYKAIGIAQMNTAGLPEDKIIELLGIFENISDIKTFIDMNLSEEDSAKVIDLVKKGANISFAVFCIKSPKIYEKALSLVESEKCKSLNDLYGGYDEEEILKELDYIGFGVPKDYVSLFLSSATDEEAELLKEGVQYEALKPLQEYEKEGNDVTLLKEYLKKGIPFETALKLFEDPKVKEIPQEVFLDSIHPSLNAEKIIFLAKLQENGLNDKFPEKDKDILIEFLSLVNDPQNIENFIDLGFINEKALENYKEFKKRGISSDNTIIISQLDFKDSLQIDRAAELLKRKIPFESILFSINDDKSFMNAIKNNKNNKSNSAFLYASLNLNSYLVKFYKLGMNREEIDLIKKEMLYSDKSDLESLTKYLSRGHNLKDAIKISKFQSYNYFFNREEEKENKKEWLSAYILKGCSFEILKEIISDAKKKEKLESYIEDGIEPKLAEKLSLYNIEPTDKEKISKIKSFENSTINEDLKKICANPTLYKYIDELYNLNNYNTYQYGQIINSDISLQDIFESGKIFVKSPLKQAMKRPNLYLSNIPVEDTEKVNGHYPKLFIDKMQAYQEKMLNFFKVYFVEITRALKYLDVDTFNQLMDKRTNTFSEQLCTLNKMDNKHYELVSKITKCRKEDGKLLSSKEKIELAKIILYHQLGYIDTSYIEDIIKNGTINISELRKILFDKLIDSIGLTAEEAKEHSSKLDFDEEYVFLLLSTQDSADFLGIKELLNDNIRLKNEIEYLESLLSKPEELLHIGLSVEKTEALIDLLKRSKKMEEEDVYKEFIKISPFASVDITAQDIARIAILEDFNRYIHDPTNSLGTVNLQTKLQFEELGLDYDKWLNYSPQKTIELNSGQYNIKLWDRNPQKDLFVGNRTSCCTAVIEGGNGKATPIYLANTAFNVIELTDKNDNIVGMSRVFVCTIDEKPSLVIENIELNNYFLKDKTPEELKYLRDEIFSYIADFASEFSNNQEMSIYFSKNYTHVPNDDYTAVEKKINFVGTLSSQSIYLNCKPGWTTKQELKENPCELYKIS